jgi:hypothetical protein
MRGISMRPLMIFLTAGLLSAGAAHAEKPFDDVTGAQLPQCPNGFNGLLPKCSIVSVITMDGQIKSCYCKQTNLGSKDNIDSVIPPKDQERTIYSQMEVGKIIDKTKPQDPCDYLVINGVRRYVCW